MLLKLIGLALAVTLPRNPSGRNCVAFDSVNQVYLVTLQGSSVDGVFVDADGGIVGSEFPISTEGASYASWASVAFGGPAGDPVFVVTYIPVEGASHPKHARFVR